MDGLGLMGVHQIALGGTPVSHQLMVGGDETQLWRPLQASPQRRISSADQLLGHPLRGERLDQQLGLALTTAEAAGQVHMCDA